MAVTNTDPTSRRGRLAPFGWLTTVFAFSPAAFGAVEFVPQVSLGVIRTDNLTLAPAGNTEAQTIYELTPSFTLSQEGPRMTSNMAYQLQSFRYDQRGQTEVFNVLDGEARVILDPENFFMDFGASRSQAVRSPEGPALINNFLLGGNRINVDEAYLGPSFQYPVGGDVTLRGNYRRSAVRYDEDLQLGGFGAAQDFDEETLGLSVDNYERGRGISWRLAYDAQKADYGIFVPWEYRQARVELGGWVGGGLRLFAAGGKESAWDRPLDPALEDRFWEAGFSGSAGENLTAEFAVGERSFGSSRRGNLQLTFRSGSTALTYNVEPTTQGSNPYDRGGLLLPGEPDNFLARVGNAERYISKRAQWNLTISLRRSDFSVVVFDESREQRTRLDGSVLADESQSGAYLNASWQLGARTEIVFNAQRIHLKLNQTNQTDERDLTTVSIGATYRLGQRTDLSLGYSNIAEEPVLGSAGLDYVARQLSLFVTRTF